MENDTDATSGALLEKVQACQTFAKRHAEHHNYLLGFAEYGDVAGIKEQLAYWLPAYTSVVEGLGPILGWLSAAQAAITDPDVVQAGEADTSAIDALGMDLPEELSRLLAEARKALEEYNAGVDGRNWAGDLVARLKKLEEDLSDQANFAMLIRDELTALSAAADAAPEQPSSSRPNW